MLDRAQQERRHALHRHLDHDAERSQPEPDGGQQLGVLGLADPQDRTVRRHQRDRDELCGEAAEPGSGSMGSRRRRPRDGLPVDVAHVLERQAVRLEESRQLVEVGAGGQRGPAALDVDREQAVEPAQVEQHALGRRDPGEAVAGADRFDGQPALARGAHDRDHLVDARRVRPEGRRRVLGTPPVAPTAPRSQQIVGVRAGASDRLAHKNAFPSPR